MLQSCIGEVPYTEINGLNNLEWDVVTLTPEFIALWLLHDYPTIAGCSGHASDGRPLPKEVHDELRAGNCVMWCKKEPLLLMWFDVVCSLLAHYKFNAIDVNRELYKSALDLALHSNSEHWDDIVGEVWSAYSAPFKQHPKDFHLCSFNDIMSDDLAASYYSALWSKVRVV